MIPAKLGSTRLLMKNLALVGGKPLIYYAIKAAMEAGVFDRIIVNAEDEIFSKIACRYGVDFYKRPDSIVSPTTKTDVVVYDFVSKYPCDIVAWISPIAPFQQGAEVRKMVEYFRAKGLDSLMTVKHEQVHCIYNGTPVNFKINEVFAQTQDLIPVQQFVYSTMMWRSSTFRKAFETRGYALLCGKVGYFGVSKLTSFIVKKEEDLKLADYLMTAMASYKRYVPRYDRIIRNIGRKR
ncbi:MAG: hypothetical protein NC933_04885 [Candidatus Omnitrophica bacterium]|nr:hypothetical protein [Candidatus Omnitrophota bacterium]